jgi:hypothetical protein
MKLNLDRFLAENDLLIAILIFGGLTTFADIVSDWEQGNCASMWIRIFELVVLFLLFLIFRARKKEFKVPIVFSEDKQKDEHDEKLFPKFIEQCSLRGEIKSLNRLMSVHEESLHIGLKKSPRYLDDPDEWFEEWQDLVDAWTNLDGRLQRNYRGGGEFDYRIIPHIPLPLSFAMGASVGLRRNCFLYHYERQQVHGPVIELANRSKIFQKRGAETDDPVFSSQGIDDAAKKTKIILHLGVTERHNFPDFQLHPNYKSAASVGYVYKKTLTSAEAWLPYVQGLFEKSLPFLKYNSVEICLDCPSPIAFALGVVFSRTPKISLCNYQGNKYVRVLSLADFERFKPIPFS